MGFGLEFDLADHQEAVAYNFFLDAGAGLGVQAGSSGTNQGASNTPAPSKAADADADNSTVGVNCCGTGAFCAINIICTVTC